VSSSAANPYAAVKAAGGASGVNGLMVWKAANVSIENLTACNFLGGSRDAGNGIWWNGGADSGKPCDGGVFGGAFGPQSCLWDDYGDALVGNTFSHNGAYGHPTNGDFAQVSLLTDPGSNCYSANHGAGGGAVRPASAAAMQAALPRCSTTSTAAGSSDSHFLGEVLCDSQLQVVAGTPASCPSGPYPRVSEIVMHPLPKSLKSMPNPCAGVPSNPWCSKRHGGG
jgi:hypothetical protein